MHRKSFPLYPFTLVFLLTAFLSTALGQHFSEDAIQDPFTGAYAIKNEQFAIWNGSAYVPVFIKGINMGISVPGTQPGQLAATAEDEKMSISRNRKLAFSVRITFDVLYVRIQPVSSKPQSQHSATVRSNTELNTIIPSRFARRQAFTQAGRYV